VIWKDLTLRFSFAIGQFKIPPSPFAAVTFGQKKEDHRA
jgi:hypothetical protein